MVSEASVHHGRGWQSREAHIMEARKQRKRISVLYWAFSFFLFHPSGPPVYGMVLPIFR
jgi:hypothetical protein